MFCFLNFWIFFEKTLMFSQRQPIFLEIWSYFHWKATKFRNNFDNFGSFCPYLTRCPHIFFSLTPISILYLFYIEVPPSPGLCTTRVTRQHNIPMGLLCNLQIKINWRSTSDFNTLHFLFRKHGIIINLSSSAAMKPSPLLTVYSATKVRFGFRRWFNTSPCCNAPTP